MSSYHSLCCCFFADSVQVMSSYCDVVVIRHPQPGAVQVSWTCLSVCLSVALSVCLFVRRSVSLFVCLLTDDQDLLLTRKKQTRIRKR